MRRDEDGDQPTHQQQTLVDDTLIHVFSFLDDPRDLCHCSLVSRAWHDVVASAIVWTHFVLLQCVPFFIIINNIK